MIGSISSSAAALFARPLSPTPANGDGRERSREAGFAPRGAEREPAVRIVGGKTASADNATSGEPKTEEATGTNTAKSANGQELTQEEKAQVAKLRARDREVRAHEQAHAAAGGGLAGAPSYSYQSGPDGRQYAVGGEVPIRASASSGNPRQAISQLQQVARAATAPANPSGQDRAVAAQARAQIAELQAQLAQEAQAKAQDALKSPESEEETAAPKTTSLPELPDLPEIAAPAGRQAGRAAPRAAASEPAPKGAAAGAPNPPERGVSSLVRRDDDADSNATPVGGPIEIANRSAGPIAAYQHAEGPHGKPAKIIGRIVSLNA